MVNSQGLRKFLEHEIQINSSVDHPYVLKCFEISYTPTHCYLVTEYCPEGDLQRYVKSKGKLTEAEALRLLRQLVAGLKYLHEHQILHRDLKSSNVFIKRGDVRIADFGLSHCFATGKTMDKLLIGTPAYMAP
jgi:serine/threonine protein kinase